MNRTRWQEFKDAEIGDIENKINILKTPIKGMENALDLAFRADDARGVGKCESILEELHAALEEEMANLKVVQDETFEDRMADVSYDRWKNSRE